MKSRLFTVLAVFAMLVALTSLIPSTAAFASADREYKFTGAIQGLPAGGLVGDWRVAGRTVHATSATHIDQEHGMAAVGVLVKVEGWKQADGSVIAASIEVKGQSKSNKKLSGIIQQLPNTPGWIGDWTVSGNKVHVTSATRLKQERGKSVALGMRAEIKGQWQADGTFNATEIETHK